MTQLLRPICRGVGVLTLVLGAWTGCSNNAPAGGTGTGGTGTASAGGSGGPAAASGGNGAGTGGGTGGGLPGSGGDGSPKGSGGQPAPATGGAGAASTGGSGAGTGGMAAGGGQGAPGGKAGSTPSSGTGGGAAGGAGAGVLGSAGSSFMATGMRLFPQNVKSPNCSYPTGTKSSDVTASYELWKSTVVVSDGAGGFRRVKKPDSGSVIGSTVSEGIGYGMVLAVYMGDQALFDDLWKYSQLHLDGQGFMNWEIAPDGSVTAGGNGGATDGDEDITWALVMADKQWGGKGTLSDTYLNLAKHMIDLIWQFEVDHTRGEMLKPGNNWGGADTTNPSYFAPAYYRVFGQVSGNTANWNKVVDSSYSIISLSLNATNGNATNGLVPAWCSSTGVPQMGLGFQNDATRTPFRVGQDYCWFGEPRAKAYLAMITNFYVGVGVDKITNGYALNGTPQPDKVYLPAGLQAASFVGPAGVGAMSDPKYQQFVDDAYAEVATLKLTAGTIYYQKSWSALSLLMMTGNLIDFTGH